VRRKFAWRPPSSQTLGSLRARFVSLNEILTAARALKIGAALVIPPFLATVDSDGQRNTLLKA